MRNTVLVYATRWGATRETAERIISEIRNKFNIEIDLINLKDKKSKNPDISGYDNIILGVSVAKFRWAKEGKNFLKKYKSILRDKNLFVFVSSGGAGLAWKKKDLEKYDQLQKKWIDNMLIKFDLYATSRRAFGGYYINQPADKAETRDWNQICLWSEEVGRIIMEMEA